MLNLAPSLNGPLGSVSLEWVTKGLIAVKWKSAATIAIFICGSSATIFVTTWGSGAKGGLGGRARFGGWGMQRHVNRTAVAKLV